jgi:GINS complex subunit 4
MMEKQAPEILQYKQELVTQLDDQINNQQNVLSEMKVTAKENFFLDIYKLEIERMKYMLKSYLRTRLSKIEKLYLHIIRHDKAEMLSDAEIQYAWNYFSNKKEHFEGCFANSLPGSFKDFVEDNGKENDTHPNNPVNPELVTPPDVQKFVFVKPNKTGKVQLNDGEPDLTLKVDDILLLPYAYAHELIENNTAEMV